MLWKSEAVDIDGDGDMDVLGAAYNANDIAWCENDGTENFTEHTIDRFLGVRSSRCTLDGDGDMDVLGAARYDDEIVWYENDGSDPIAGLSVRLISFCEMPFSLRCRYRLGWRYGCGRSSF